MAQKFATEYTPELNQEYLANLLNQNVNEEAANVGQARQEGEAAGLVGQAATGTRVAAAEDNYDKNINAAVTGFNLDVAGKQYDERSRDENYAFQDVERQKEEDFKKSLDEMGYDFNDKERSLNNTDLYTNRRSEGIAGQQGYMLGTVEKPIGGAVSAGVGSFFSGLGG